MVLISSCILILLYILILFLFSNFKIT
ncbi:unnamed protein product [Spirodela intermedia]|uniref:Uncharacterized protein n=1 Tax=Spirodela intermedia TaxID=51605 RepID=A0A7I8J589_SPIIN|nr:unnamed protein product [Spirodela intermedia]CAA6665397.1 unnamed protein product [Spirodela intermedia]